MATNPNTSLELVGPVRRGRPSLYSDELAAVICERIADGETLTSICSDDDMPARATVTKWLMEDRGGFCSQYARAREVQAHVEAEEIRDIADDASGDVYIEMQDGVPVAKIDGDHVRRAQLRIATRQWRAERLNRRVYGQKVEHSVATPPPPTLEGSALPEALAFLAGDEEKS